MQIGDVMPKTFRYSEIFGRTFQGEGHYTGVPTVWFRSWGCNFECAGFGQQNPGDPSTYDLDYLKVNPDEYTSMRELPVFSKGCDSSYSWAKKFSHLAEQKSADEICEEIESFMKNQWNPEGKFLHPKSKQWTHLAFTGGEPMLAQTAMVEIMHAFKARDNVPKHVTVETNGTQEAREPFIRMVEQLQLSSEFGGMLSDNMGNPEWFWSISPKLYASGEKWEKAIRPETVRTYFEISPMGQLKYVVDGSDRCWQEVEEATRLYRQAGIPWPVWIMPVGADKEGQDEVAARISEEAIDRGYNVAARVHTYVFGNVVGK